MLIKMYYRIVVLLPFKSCCQYLIVQILMKKGEFLELLLCISYSCYHTVREHEFGLSCKMTLKRFLGHISTPRKCILTRTLSNCYFVAHLWRYTASVPKLGKYKSPVFGSTKNMLFQEWIQKWCSILIHKVETQLMWWYVLTWVSPLSLMMAFLKKCFCRAVWFSRYILAPFLAT